MNKQSILIVGAGAVGQVYAQQFARAGHDVHLFLKEKYVAEAQQGFTLYHLNEDKKRIKPITFKNFHCHSDWSTVAERQWHQIWLCMSSTGFAQMDLQPLVQAVGDATIVVLQPGPDDIQRVKDTVGAERVVSGMINMISYHTPLATETVAKEGIAFWIPPLIPMPVEGDHARAEVVIETLKQSKIPASYQAGYAAKGIHGNAFLMVFLAALEINNWQYKSLAANKADLKMMIDAQQEAFAALSQHYGTSAPYALTCVKSWMISPLMTASRYIAPLDMETYMQAHFSKVRSQTVAILQLFIDRAQQYQLKHESLSALVAQMA
jgi:2-dehydropantoate 2-reductase